MRAVEQLQIADGEAVEPHVALGHDAAEARDVAELIIFGALQIMQHRSGGHLRQLQLGHPEAFEIFYIEMPQ